MYVLAVESGIFLQSVLYQNNQESKNKPEWTMLTLLPLSSKFCGCAMIVFNYLASKKLCLLFFIKIK